MFQKFIAKLSKQEKLIFYITVGVVLVALLDRLFFGPALAKLKSIDQEIDRQKAAIEGDLRILAYKDKILRKSKAFRQYFVEKIPDDDVVNAAFLSKIEQLATQSRVNLVKSNPSEKRQYKQYVEYYANLDCTGELKDVLTFMHLINTTDELLKVHKFNMVPKRGAANEVNASMTVMKLMMIPPDA